jgi:hypothetical protein
MRILHRKVMAAAIVTAAAITTMGAGALPGSTMAALASCKPGAYTSVLTNYGDVFYPADTLPSIDNENSTPVTQDVTTSYTGGISSTVSASLGISVSDMVTTVNAQLGVSTTVSESLNVKITQHYTASPDSTLHIQYGGDKLKTYLEHYSLTASCSPYNIHYGYGYADDGKSWYTWTTYDG